MESSYIALMELFIVAAALIGWGVMELVGLRLDKRRREEDEAAKRKRNEPQGGDGPGG